MCSKIITMSCKEDNQTVDITMQYDEFVAWPELIQQFNQFLCSMGYIPRKYNHFVTEIESDVD